MPALTVQEKAGSHPDLEYTHPDIQLVKRYPASPAPLYETLYIQDTRLQADCFAARQTKAMLEISARLHLGRAEALLELGPYLALIRCQHGLVCFE